MRTESDRASVIRAIEGRALPCTVQISKGAPRSIEQNRLGRLWLKEAEDQGDHTAEEYRGLCKLWFGVDILLNEDDEFREVYETTIAPLQYEKKLACMMVPIDLPITRRMNTNQKKRYLDRIYTHFTGKGFQLTDPDTMGVDLK